MIEPIWIEESALLAVHQQLLARFGGLDGIRDKGMLDSAINRPLHLFHYEKADLFRLAAAYTYGLVKNHPFLDGNKRIGFMAAYTFLGVNGYELDATEEAAVIMTRDLAAGELPEAAYAQWLKDNCTKQD